ncbi:MAG: efflux RND transporter periplasmic adaptor subunit [Alicyclobacillaceae bacterium]|nr:efflux RND transporter periplasmic adaptor subunit [Alicyclobacillaceae bacterium]
MNRRGATLGSFLAVSSLVLFLASGCSLSGSSTVMQDGVPEVQAFTVSGEGGQTVTGKIAPADEVKLSSKLAGKVAAVYVQEGSSVRKGQVLVELDSGDYAAQVRQAEAGLQQAEAGLAAARAKLADTLAGAREQQIQQLEAAVEQAKAAYENAQTNYNRTKNLFDAGAASQAALDQAQLGLANAKGALDQAQAQLSLAKAGATANTIAALEAQVRQAEGAVNQARAALDLARSNLDNTRITAPVDGIVSKKSINPGEMAAPGTPLLTLVNLGEVKVNVSVPQSLLPAVKSGASVKVRVAEAGDRTFTGTVSFISPVSDDNNNTFPVKVTVPNPDGLLRAGMVAEVTFGEGGGNAVEIPAGSVVNRDGKTYVYKLNGDRVQLVEVQGRPKDDRWFVVTSGVRASDRLVAQPGPELKDGQQVRVRGGDGT